MNTNFVNKYTEAVNRLSNIQDPLHVNYWKQQQQRYTENVNTENWHLNTIDAEIQKLNKIKNKLLFKKEISNLPSYYFSNFFKQ